MNINLETNKSQKQQEPKVVCAKSSNRTVDKGDGESDEDDASDITLKDSQINEKISSVVVSVKKYVEHSEMDELTILFRKMIGIDRSDTVSSIVRQFSCSFCYRYWWRRVRLYKQVSRCFKCRKKYDPIPFNKEFGMGEYVCDCSHKYFQWCSKETFTKCIKCNSICYPKRIMANPNPRLGSNNSLNCGTNSSSDDSQPRQSKNYRRSYKPTSRKFHCDKCEDTNINMESSIVFRPKIGSYMHYLHTKKSKKNTGISFCKYCRKIPMFSAIHVSTASTLDSLSFQGDLNLRFINNEIDQMGTCIEINSDDENI